MGSNIVVGFPGIQGIEQQRVEIVERKGLGHPDSLCDGIAESISRALSREYLKRYGRILHHNTDQVELVGGAADPVFGGGEMIKPVYFLLSGRATNRIGEERIPVSEIAIKTAREYLDKNLKHIDIDEFAELDEKLGEGSADLKHVFDDDGMPKSNDTSFGVGFAPFSLVEKTVLETERYINSKLKIKAIGEDVKVMGVRNNDKISLTIAAAIVSEHVQDINDYVNVIEEAHEKLSSFTSKLAGRDMEININTADNYDKESVYLTYTGTSAEQGDDGSVGRGNRANGLITPYRPSSMEATSGKNPVNHVGKIYNLLSNEIARDIAKEGAKEVHVRIMSQIGKPINKPVIASVNIIDDHDGKLEKEAYRITEWWLENITEITDLCVKGKVTTF
ncbi:MAG: methionine adenosyltransferase [Candidatus Altiarchaeota archaeon]|nr:methionine adenosyltransferase [Candidatus Altiarchaeota archaeon]